MTISPEVLKQLTEIIQKVRSEEKSSVLIIVQVSQILLELEKADR
jgi:ABC-type branched-subunit amino acid transport system ATPase component